MSVEEHSKRLFNNSSIGTLVRRSMTKIDEIWVPHLPHPKNFWVAFIFIFSTIKIRVWQVWHLHLPLNEVWQVWQVWYLTRVELRELRRLTRMPKRDCWFANTCIYLSRHDTATASVVRVSKLNGVMLELVWGAGGM
jgi:hypothetical protein